MKTINKTLNSNRGHLAVSLMAGVVCTVAFSSFIKVLPSVATSRINMGKQIEFADTMTDKLEELLNRQSSDALLAETSPTTPHTEGDLAWEVTNVTNAGTPTRLKKITIRAALPSPAHSGSITGYRYDDF